MTRDEILQELQEKLSGLLGERLTTDETLIANINAQITNQITELVSDPEFTRKFSFASETPAPQLIGSKFARHGLSVGDIEFLYDMQLGLARSQPNRFNGPSEELTNAFEHISRAMYVPMEEIRAMDQRALDGMFPRIPLTELSLGDRALAKRGAYQETDAYQRAYRAMDTAESGYGSQLVGAQYVGELWAAARNVSRVFNLLTTFEMSDPTAYLPVEADIPEMLFVSENTANNSSNYATSKTGSQRVQVDAKKFVIHQMWSGEMEEDSIIAYIGFLRRQAVLSIAHYSDSLVLNGDTTNAATGNINLDDADPADTKHYLAFDGIRYAALVDNTANASDAAGAITWAKLVGAYSRMLDTTNLMDWGHPTNSADLVHICDPTTGDKIGQLSEVVNWRTQAGRSLLPGQEAEVLGHPVISSIALSKTEADGKVSTTAGNNTLGQVVTFNTRGFAPGWRRRVQTEVERLPATDQTRIVHSLRLGFGRYSPTGAASGIEAADVIYNITL